MKKISKKIVSLVTLAAFALTLVPAAAFAADLRSTVSVVAESEEISLDTNGEAVANIELNVGTGDQKVAPIYVWLTKDDSNNIYRYVTEWTAKSSTGDAKATNGSTGELVSALKINGNNVNEGGKIDITAKIEEAGTYKVHAGIAATAADYVDRGDLSPIDVEGEGTIVVTAADSSVNEITVAGATPTQGGGSIAYEGGEPNGIRSTKVVATVKSVYEDNKPASSNGKVLEVTNPYSNITISDADGVVGEDNPIVIGDGDDADDQATFYVKADQSSKHGTYTLTLTVDGYDYLLSIKIGTEDNKAATIEAVDTGKTVFEKTTGDWVALDSVAQFVVKNADGDVLAPADNPEGFTAFTANSTGEMNKNIGIVNKPEKANPEFKVVASSKNADNYTLQVKDGAKMPVGDYTVRVALDNNKAADVSFTVDTFGKVVDTVIEFTDENGKVVDEVVDNGTEYTAKALQVDENGLTRPVGTANMGYTGVAATEVDSNAGAGELKFKVNDDDLAGDNKYVGSKIGVYAFTTAYGKMAYGEVTVVDEANVFDYTLEFDPTNGSAGEDNIVDVTVVDKNGKKVNVNGDLYVTFMNSSVEDANVYVDKKVDVEKGQGEIVVNSDKETELEILVGVKLDGTDGVIVANTLKYTVGAEDINADTSVVMTIGSSDYVVNNEIVTGDAAPYIDGNWRTMVPVRALAETFGAEVTFEDNVITIVDGDKTIVMTVGEEAYTVNDEEKTMDTVPVIGEGDRTFVPTRFVAEALGYTVTPLQDANGLTASVVFQK